MKKKQLRFLIKSDLFRYYGNKNMKSFLRAFFSNGGFQISIFYRISNYLSERNSKILLLVSKLLLKITCLVYNCDIHTKTKFGSGLYLSHCSGIIINGLAIIGDNVNISQQVTIGISGRGPNRGVPEIGNQVYIGPGAKVFGKIKIGNNVAIGANAVVNKDLPDNSVAVGVPAKIISDSGSLDFILNTDY